MKCSNCNKEIKKVKKVGPELIYCDDECYLRDCIEKHPGTSLANIVARIRPDLAITKECESGQFTFKLQLIEIKTREMEERKCYQLMLE